MKKLLLAAFICAPLFATAEPFTYKGVQLGSTVEAFKEALPFYGMCTSTSCTYMRQGCSSGSGGRFTADACSNGTSFGGQQIDYGRAEFIDGKFSLAYLKFRSDGMDSIAKALEEKYGAPTEIDASPIKTKAGVEYPSWRKTWVQEDGTLVASKHAGSISEGLVLLSSPEANRAAKEREAAKAAKAAKDF